MKILKFSKNCCHLQIERNFVQLVYLLKETNSAYTIQVKNFETAFAIILFSDQFRIFERVQGYDQNRFNIIY